MIKKILIANRGEIAVRIIRTCRDMEISTISLYEDSDCASLHVLLSDECVRLDSPLGYMDQELIISLAKSRGAAAIHPGYGFLAESPEFARACSEAGLVFIGPEVESLNFCASKINLLNMVAQCGVPVPQYSSEAFSPGDRESIMASAEQLAFPLFVKALKGSNIRACRLVKSREELDHCVDWCSIMGASLFGDNQVYLEKAILPNRTILVPFLADGHSEPSLLGIIDVSLHRHHNRIVCETPATALKNEEALIASANQVIKAIGYRGLGGLEFLLDQTGDYYFLGLQARIQIEHPVVEHVSGLDLVQEQIRIASSDTYFLPRIQRQGVAMQCRVYAEDLLRQNLPSPGRLSRFRMPGGPHVRADAFTYGGCQIPLHFDPLLATITCWGTTREECLRRMRRALRDTAITGVKTNLARIQSLMYDNDFVLAHYDCNTAIDSNKLSISSQSNASLAAIAAVAYATRTQRRTQSLPERFSGKWHASIRTSLNS